jgi:hypothetical protein
LSFCLGVLAVFCGVLGVPALGFGLYVRMSARRDLVKMRTGEMDPDGEAQAQAALQDANLGTVLSAVGLLIWTVAGVLMFFLFT